MEVTQAQRNTALARITPPIEDPMFDASDVLEQMELLGWRPAADVWDEALAEFRRVMLQRSGTYEADIDVLAIQNPYRTEPE